MSALNDSIMALADRRQRALNPLEREDKIRFLQKLHRWSISGFICYSCGFFLLAGGLFGLSVAPNGPALIMCIVGLLAILIANTSEARMRTTKLAQFLIRELESSKEE